MLGIIQVRVFGEPPPTVHWKHNDRPLYTTLDTRTESDINGWYRVVIENTLPQHSGMYTVIAKVSISVMHRGMELSYLSILLITREIENNDK